MIDISDILPCHPRSFHRKCVVQFVQKKQACPMGTQKVSEIEGIARGTPGEVTFEYQYCVTLKNKCSRIQGVLLIV